MDDQKQPDIPGIGSETFQLKLEKDWFQPDYVIGVDTAYYDCEKSVVSVMKKEENTEGQVAEYYDTAIIKETQPPPTFKQLQENMRKWAPQLFTYTITGALCWLNHYCAGEQRRKEWLGSMINQRMAVHTGIKLFNPYGKG